MNRWLKAALVALAIAAPIAFANAVNWKLWVDCGSLAGSGIVYFIVGEEPHVYAFSCGGEA